MFPDGDLPAFLAEGPRVGYDEAILKDSSEHRTTIDISRRSGPSSSGRERMVAAVRRGIARTPPRSIRAVILPDLFHVTRICIWRTRVSRSQGRFLPARRRDDKRR